MFRFHSRKPTQQSLGLFKRVIAFRKLFRHSMTVAWNQCTNKPWKVLPDSAEDLYFCICGHELIHHYLTGDGCNFCFFESKPQDKWQHRFQLDNLFYIEELAKKRGLV